MTPENEFEADSVREWIRGEGILLQPAERPGDVFADIGTAMFDAIQWMPTDLRKRVMRRWLDEDEYEETDQ